MDILEEKEDRWRGRALVSTKWLKDKVCECVGGGVGIPVSAFVCALSGVSYICVRAHLCM